MRHGDPMPHETDRSDAEQIALNASMAHHPAGGVDWSGFDEFKRPTGDADLPPLVPMSSAVMADAQAQIAGMDRDYCPPAVVVERGKVYGFTTLAAYDAALKSVIDSLNAVGAQRDQASAKLARVEALIATWHKSPDLRTRAHADRLSEAFDGRPRE